MHFYDPNPGRPELVPTLRAMTIEQLSAYCTAVLAAHANIPLQPLPVATVDIRHRECPICGADIEHDTHRRGRPRIACPGACTQALQAAKRAA